MPNIRLGGYAVILGHLFMLVSADLGRLASEALGADRPTVIYHYVG